MSTTYESIGVKIKLARLEAGMTQEELAEKVGVTSVMISRYESGKTSPMRQIDEISKHLGKDPEFFLGDSNKEKLYEEVKSLVQMLKDKAAENAWPFKPTVPLLNYADIEGFLDSRDLSTISNIEEKERIEVVSSILNNDKESFAVSIGNNFAKSVIPQKSVVVISPNTVPNDKDLVLRLGKTGLVVGKKSTTRGKMVGTVVQSILKKNKEEA